MPSTSGFSLADKGETDEIPTAEGLRRGRSHVVYTGPVISVVVLALNEEARLPACLAALAGQSPQELIVVDGGSADGSVGVASAAGARVVVSRRGRALQANRGAGEATGDVLEANRLLEGEVQRRPVVSCRLVVQGEVVE